MRQIRKTRSTKKNAAIAIERVLDEEDGQSPPSTIPALELRSSLVRRGSGKGARISSKRSALRDAIWNDAEELVWTRHLNDGYTTVPRLLPLIHHLIRLLSKKGDPSKAYFELWARVFDEGFVVIANESDHAYAAGYSGTRAIRTWSEHIWELQRLGFLRVKGQGIRDIAYVLIVNPLRVCAELHQASRTEMPPEWWTAFVGRASEIGARIPTIEISEIGEKTNNT